MPTGRLWLLRFADKKAVSEARRRDEQTPPPCKREVGNYGCVLCWAPTVNAGDPLD